MTITRKLGSFAATGALMFGAACSTDLDIANPNNPDIERALASAEDVAQLASSSVNSWYLNSTYYLPLTFSSVTSDILTMNYGNFAARFNNVEPRIAYNNSSAADDGTTASVPWDANYGALGAANDALRAFASGVALEDAGETEAAKHLAMFTQAASLTNLALWFNQAFVVDENTDPAAEIPQLVPYTDVSAAALAKWDALIAATAGKNHAYEESVLPLQGGNLTSPKLNRIANTFAALLMAYTPRNATEAAAVNWAKVADYTNKGIGTGSAGAPLDMTIMADNDLWYSYHVLYGNYPAWMRVDMKVINMMDPTQPAKYAGKVPPKATGDARINTDFRFMGSATERAEIGSPTRDSIVGDPARGLYMMSPYQHKRYEYHAWHSATYATGPVPYIRATESDLLRAEALVRTGNAAGAVPLINATRVGRGQLTPVTAAMSQAELLDAINYERRVELIATNGFELQRNRLTSWLQAGTARHLPVPAKELEVLSLPVYTFGGASGEQ